MSLETIGSHVDEGGTAGLTDLVDQRLHRVVDVEDVHAVDLAGTSMPYPLAFSQIESAMVVPRWIAVPIE